MSNLVAIRNAAGDLPFVRPNNPGLIAAVLLAFAALTAGAAGPAMPGLSKKERSERIRLMPEEERRWLQEIVSPIILPDEETLFLLLTQPHQCEMFKAEFWKRRELPGLAPPLGPGYQIRYLHLREIAASEYDGINSDAGRMVVRKGEPASIQNLSDNLYGCNEVYRQAEIWTYPSPSAGSSTPINHIFYRPTFGAPRKLWLPGDRNIFQTASSRGFRSSLRQDRERFAAGRAERVLSRFRRSQNVRRSLPGREGRRGHQRTQRRRRRLVGAAGARRLDGGVGRPLAAAGLLRSEGKTDRVHRCRRRADGISVALPHTRRKPDTGRDPGTDRPAPAEIQRMA